MKTLKQWLLPSALFLFVFLSSCAGLSVQATSGSSASDGTRSGTSESSAQSTSIWSGWSDFNSWSQKITLDKSFFASVQAGDSILIEHTASSTSTDGYIKLKVYYTGSSWVELTGGSYANASYDSVNTGISPDSADQTTSYTLSADNAQKLKECGLALNGYGLVIKKISLVTSSSATTSSTTTTTTTTPTVTPDPEPATVTGTPYAVHGKLHVSGAYLYDSHNKKMQLYGMSTHGLNFGSDFSRYVNRQALADLRDKWNTNCIRLVLYPRDYKGYCNGGNQAELKNLMKTGINLATELGMYVLVDWHVHNYNPQETQSQAITFLQEIASQYASYGNVLYEICNEPTGALWDSAIKPYAQAVIPVIRKYAKDAVVIVGTNTWSQDVEGPLASPLPASSYGNVMYTFHFYANTHTDTFRTRVENAIKKGLPIFITEFGTCDASGNGGFNSGESEKWFQLIKNYNISHMNWSLCNKGETASAIKSSVSKTSGWTISDLTESGLLIYNHFRSLER